MKLKQAVVLATALSLAPISAFAAKKAAPAAPKAVIPTLDAVLGASGINLSGTVDASYDWSTATAGAVGGHSFDQESSSFVFHQLNTTVSKQWSNGLSLAVNTIVGNDADILTAGGTNNVRGAALGLSDFALVQAYLAYSLGDLTLMGGRFVTLAGSEVINSAGNINASRGFLFTALQPLTHTGVRGTYALCKNLTLTGGVLNSGALNAAGGANNALNNNSNLSWEFQTAYSSSIFSSAFTMYTGDESTVNAGSGASASTSTLYDIVVSVTPVDMLTLGLNADFNRAEGAAAGGTTQDDFGIAGYVNVKITPKARVAFRGEYVSLDSNAVATQYNHYNTLTGTFGYSPLSGLELIAEARFDNQSQTGVPDGGRVALTKANEAAGTIAYQNSATLKAIYRF